uniref:Uncharacterized protein n=1 Tax=Timema poppense TaxID=170557 RepID=A0A7R9CYI3_TIMPO|nr:unnamed protein product [Timema poppensis]
MSHSLEDRRKKQEVNQHVGKLKRTVSSPNDLVQPNWELDQSKESKSETPVVRTQIKIHLFEVIIEEKLIPERGLKQVRAKLSETVVVPGQTEVMCHFNLLGGSGGAGGPNTKRFYWARMRSDVQRWYEDYNRSKGAPTNEFSQQADGECCNSYYLSSDHNKRKSEGSERTDKLNQLNQTHWVSHSQDAFQEIVISPSLHTGGAETSSGINKGASPGSRWRLDASSAKSLPLSSVNSPKRSHTGSWGEQDSSGSSREDMNSWLSWVSQTPLLANEEELGESPEAKDGRFRIEDGATSNRVPLVIKEVASSGAALGVSIQEASSIPDITTGRSELSIDHLALWQCRSPCSQQVICSYNTDSPSLYTLKLCQVLTRRGNNRRAIIRLEHSITCSTSPNARKRTVLGIGRTRLTERSAVLLRSWEMNLGPLQSNVNQCHDVLWSYSLLPRRYYNFAMKSYFVSQIIAERGSKLEISDSVKYPQRSSNADSRMIKPRGQLLVEAAIAQYNVKKPIMNQQIALNEDGETDIFVNPQQRCDKNTKYPLPFNCMTAPKYLRSIKKQGCSGPVKALDEEQGYFGPVTMLPVTKRRETSLLWTCYSAYLIRGSVKASLPLIEDRPPPEADCATYWLICRKASPVAVSSLIFSVSASDSTVSSPFSLIYYLLLRRSPCLARIILSLARLNATSTLFTVDTSVAVLSRSSSMASPPPEALPFAGDSA